MDYRELIEKANRAAIKWKKENLIIGVGKLQVDNMVFYLTKAITELLNRVEIAEKECNELRESMKPNCLQCESMHKNGNCMEVGGFCTSVPAAYCPLIPKLLRKISEAEFRAEKAERKMNAVIKDLERIKSCKVCKHCDSLKTPIPEICKKCHHGDKWEWNKN